MIEERCVNDIYQGRVGGQHYRWAGFSESFNHTF